MFYREIFYSLYFFLPLISSSSQALVKWLPDSSLNLPISFEDGRLPCSKKTLIFPEHILGSVKVNKEMDVNAIILPMSGEIFVEGTLNIGEDQYDTNCTEGNAYYVDSSRSSWAQANVWTSSKFNNATPDAERVPCFDDVVEFPEDIHSIVLLPNSFQRVKYVKIGNRSFKNNEQFWSYITNESNEPIQFIVNIFFNEGLIFGDKQCDSLSGCPCQENVLKIDCRTKFCPIPSCAHPITPVGHCCEICGGYILFDAANGFNINEFKNLVDDTVGSYGRDKLEYHIGRLPNDKVQLVIVDKDDYEGTSAQVLNVIDHSMQTHWIRGAKFAQISGSPLYESGSGGKIFISVFFLVIFALGMIYAYYYKLPEVRVPIMGRSFTNIFARIQRRSDSVVSLTRRDSVMTTTGVRTAFRNPMYDSKRGRVQVAEEVTPQ